MSTKGMEYLGAIPIATIVVKNRFRIDKGEIDEMAKSLKDKGQLQPIIVNKKMKLLAGERRMLAAQQLGWENITAIMRATDGDTIDEMEVELEENVKRKQFAWPEVARLERAIWDMRERRDPKWSLRRAEEERGISKSQIGMRLQLAEALDMLPELGECETQDEAWKKYKKLEEVATVGMLRDAVPEKVRQAPQWAKDHYIVGDAFEGMAALGDESFDFAEVDPPYAIDLLRRKGRNKGDGNRGDYNEVSSDEFPDFMERLCQSVYRLLKPNSFAVFWYAMQWHQKTHDWLTGSGFQVNPMPALWYKGQSGQTAQPDVALASVYEPFFLARKGTPKMMRQGRANVFHYSTVPPNSKIHPTERPTELLVDIVETICFPGSNILVPFLGSGATLRAAYKTGHTGMGFDLAEGNRKRFLEAVTREFSSDGV